MSPGAPLLPLMVSMLFLAAALLIMSLRLSVPRELEMALVMLSILSRPAEPDDDEPRSWSLSLLLVG